MGCLLALIDDGDRLACLGQPLSHHKPGTVTAEHDYSLASDRVVCRKPVGVDDLCLRHPG